MASQFLVSTKPMNSNVGRHDQTSLVMSLSLILCIRDQCDFGCTEQGAGKISVVFFPQIWSSQTKKHMCVLPLRIFGHNVDAKNRAPFFNLPLKVTTVFYVAIPAGAMIDQQYNRYLWFIYNYTTFQYTTNINIRIYIYMVQWSPTPRYATPQCGPVGGWEV